jgi:hypothetical protein
MPTQIKIIRINIVDDLLVLRGQGVRYPILYRSTEKILASAA